VKRIDGEAEGDADGARQGTGEQANEFYEGPDQGVFEAFAQWGVSRFQSSVLRKTFHASAEN
jgi:hypothetical protein